MKKLLHLFFLSVILFNVNTAYSQVSLTVNGGIQMPTGDFSNLVSSGTGYTASVGFSIPLIPIDISVTAGYNTWANKAQTSVLGASLPAAGNFYAVPVTIGPKLYLPIPLLFFNPYLGVDGGFVYSNSTESGASSSTNFIYSGMIGLRLSLPPGIIAIDINVKDSNFKVSGKTFSWIGINAGIVLSI
jgi:hypothetical protein